MPAVSTITNLVARLDISEFAPQRGQGLEQEIKCYSLPYGALGFVSHILTYYTIICLWSGRSPFWPVRQITYGKFQWLLGALGLMLTLGISIFTIISCKNTWQLLVIAIWKMAMSLLNGITAVHVGSVCKAQQEKGNYEPLAKRTRSTAWWVVLYIPGMFAGMSGLMSLVVQHLNILALKYLTIAFYSVVGIGVAGGVVGAMAAGCKKTPKGHGDEQEAVLAGIGGFAICVLLFTVFAALYGDWALGLMTHNLVGLPSGDNTLLYWTYFAAKRLPMFSW